MCGDAQTAFPASTAYYSRSGPCFGGTSAAFVCCSKPYRSDKNGPSAGNHSPKGSPMGFFVCESRASARANQGHAIDQICQLGGCRHGRARSGVDFAPGLEEAEGLFQQEVTAIPPSGSAPATRGRPKPAWALLCANYSSEISLNPVRSRMRCESNQSLRKVRTTSS